MSTTVTYKGQVLTTVTNGTKKLLTAGKYMEDDVTMVDDSMPVIPSGAGFTSYNYNDLNLTWTSHAEEGA